MFGVKSFLKEYLITGKTNVLEQSAHEISECKEIFEDGTFIKIE